MQEGVPCPNQPYAGTLVFLAKDAHTKVAEIAADSSGHYRLALAPGTCILHPESPGILPRGTDAVIVMLPRKFTHQAIVYDTGIR